MSVTVTMTPNRPNPTSARIFQVKTTGFYKAKDGNGLWHIDPFNKVFVSIGDNHFAVCKTQDCHDREVVPVEGMDINIKIST